MSDKNLEREIFQAVVRSTTAIMLCSRKNSASPIEFVNAAFTELTGYAAEEAIGRDPRFLQGPKTDLEAVADLRQAVTEGRAVSTELLNYRKSGEPFWNQLAISPVRDDAGEVVSFLGLGFDTSHLHALAERSEEEVRLGELVRHLPGFVFSRIMRPDGSIELAYMGPTLNQILGEPEHVRIDWPVFAAHIHPEDRAGWISDLVDSAARRSRFSTEYRIVSNSRAVSWFRSEATSRLLPDGSVVWDGVALDITGEKATQAKVLFLESHDRLTGVTNRAGFRQALADAIAPLEHEAGAIQVIVLDIDRFQEINDSAGHATADALLRAVAQRLSRHVDPLGGCVARIGGDEFAVFLPLAPPPEDALAAARRLSRRVARPFRVSGARFSIEASIGVTVFRPGEAPPPPDLGEDLMRQADLALQAVKRDDPGGLRLYSSDLEDDFRHRIALRESLGAGLSEGQFELHYQPIVEIGGGDLVGAEALVRWNHPELGLQSAGRFVPIAEASGLIVPLGEWILREALRQGRAWRDAGLAPARVAINVSSLQLRHKPSRARSDFVATVERALDETGADPRQFEFELTESMLIESSDETLGALQTLKAMGFTIAIDDFGTGHATFRYLRDFPVDRLKIDRSFVSRIGVDLADEIILRTLVSLGRSLGIGVIAEGIETEAQRQFLLGLGCTLGQGYLFSMPLKAEDFGWMLGRQMILPARRATS